MNNIEEKRNKLNFELRALLKVIDMIDGKTFDYKNYEKHCSDEEKFLDDQIVLVADAKLRLIDLFK